MYKFSYYKRRVFEKLLGPILHVLPKSVSRCVARVFRYSETAFGWSIRTAAYSRLCKRMGSGVHIAPGVMIFDPESLEIGDGVSINEFAFVSARGGMVIGDGAAIGHRCSLLSTEHDFGGGALPDREFGLILKPTIIGKCVIVHAGSIVLGGVTLGDGCIITAGAVVRRDVPPRALAGGVPAKILREPPVS